MDNSPAWDGPLSRVEPVSPRTFRRRDLDSAAATERPTDADYGRYIRLAASYRESGYTDDLCVHEFAVEDPLFNSLLAASEAALADIAGEIGTDPSPHTATVKRLRQAIMDVLFVPGEGAFAARDVNSGSLLRGSIAGLTPIVVPGLPMADTLVNTALGERFRIGQLGLPPSYDLTAERFDAQRYWRGPAWFNIAWLIWRGLRQYGRTELAAHVRAALLRTAQRAGFHEYFNPLTGQGHGTREFGWTAAITLDMLCEDPR